MRNVIRAMALGLWALAAVGGAQAQGKWPEKVVRLVVPFAPGGSTDLIGRQIAEELTGRLGMQVIVENRPGAGGTTGSELVAKAVPDGHTLLLGSVSTHAVAPSVYANLHYDPLKDFTPLTVVATIPNVVVVNPEVPAKTLPEFVRLAKAAPGKYSFASNGQGTSNHLATALLASAAGMQLTHVPYKGSGPALNDTVAGHVNLMADVVMTSTPYIRSRRLRALAVTSATRSPLLPDVPTVAEQGYPGFEAIVWFGLFAPPQMAPALVERISGELIAVIRGPRLGKYLEEQGAQPSGIAPAAFAKLLRDDMSKWAQVARAAGIKPE